MSLASKNSPWLESVCVACTPFGVDVGVFVSSSPGYHALTGVAPCIYVLLSVPFFRITDACGAPPPTHPPPHAYTHPRSPDPVPFLKVRETMTAAVELTADGFLQQINEYECIRDLGTGATAEVGTAEGRGHSKAEGAQSGRRGGTERQTGGRRVANLPGPPLGVLEADLSALPSVRLAACTYVHAEW